METKPCQTCGKEFERDPRITQAAWEARRFCSRKCYGVTRRAIKTCKACGKEYRRVGSKGVGLVYCSTECAYADRGAERHYNWKEGNRLGMSGGYVGTTISPTHPLFSMAHKNGRVMVHRLVMAEALGRPLERHETIHHINGDRSDNRLENLQLRNGRHGKGMSYTCRDCGSHNVEAREL